MRRRARREGFEIRKSHTRVPEALDYGMYWMIEPYVNNCIVAGGDGWTLDEVDEWLTEREGG